MFLRNGILLVANECVFVGERGRGRELLHSHTICRCTDLFTFELPFSFGKLLRCKVRLKTAHMHFGFLSVYCFTQCALSHYFTQLFVLRCCAFVSFSSFFLFLSIAITYNSRELVIVIAKRKQTNQNAQVRISDSENIQ